jgi:hypothetical protein
MNSLTNASAGGAYMTYCAMCSGPWATIRVCLASGMITGWTICILSLPALTAEPCCLIPTVIAGNALPEQWPWSSFRFYFLNDDCVLPMDRLP